MKEQLAIFIEAARARGEALDHVLLAGPPGLGKTSLAQIVANELGAGFVPTAGPALERKGDVASYLTALEPRSVFFVDEIHRLPRALEETFYPAMEDRKLPITVGQGAGAARGLARPARVHADRRHHPHGAAHHPAARPLRRDPPPRAVRAGRPRPDRAPLGGHPRRGDRHRGRRGDRAPLARHAARGEPPAQARARLRRGARRGPHRRERGARGARPARGGRRRARPPRPRDPPRHLREVRRRAGRASARWPWRWGRSPTRSRTSTSHICSSRVT